MVAPSPPRPFRPALFRWGAALASALALGAALTAGAAEWPLRGPQTLQAIARQVEAAYGLEVEVTGPAGLRLLPRPLVELGAVAFRTRDGTVRIDAERLRGSLDLTALATGEVRLAHVWLGRPTVTVDADRLKSQVAPMLHGEPARLAGLMRTAGLSLRDGVVRVQSANPAADLLLTDVSGSFSWPTLGAGASLTGSATWRGTALTGSLDLDSPDALLAGGGSLASFHLRSEPIDLQGIVTLSGSGDSRAVGRIAATTRDLAGFLRLIQHPAPQLGGFSRAHLDGTVAATDETLSISDATVGLGDMQFEGALAVRRKGDRPALAATLATDRIDIGRFLDQLPAVADPDGPWTSRPLDTLAIADDAIDLRVSAAHATLGRLVIEDSSLSLQSGDGRLEMSLGEARAYDGLVKARVVAAVEGGATVARLDAALSRIDLGKLLKDAGAPVGSGILTGHLGIESRGASPDALARAAQGRGELTLRDGTLDLPALTAATRNGDAAPTRVTDLAATFDDAVVRFGVRRGAISLVDSGVTWPQARAELSGSASLPERRLDLKAVVTPDTDGDPVAFGIAGPWRDLQLSPVRASSPPRPPS